MVSAPPSETATQSKSRRSLLPSLNFGSSSSSSSFTAPASTPGIPPSSSAASAASAEPDYFATIHVPDPNAPNPGAVRIASPFALATPLVSASGARLPSRSSHTNDHIAPDLHNHPWAKLFPDGGMTTALPDAFHMRPLAVPQTPAANAASVKNNTFSPASAATPDFRHQLNLPASLKGAISSSASLPLPASSAASSSTNQKPGASTTDLTKFKALDVDALAETLKPPSWKHRLAPSSSSRTPSSASAAPHPAAPDDVLILDIRPSTSFSTARVVSSINICAPSTLLKRPAITVERIEDEMLGSLGDRRRFMRWRKGPLKPKSDAKPGASDASIEATRKRGATISLPEEPGINKIIVLDTDTSRIDGAGNATAGGGGPCLIGVLKKFDAAGFAGELCWLVGGFNKLARSKRAHEFIDTDSLNRSAHDKPAGLVGAASPAQSQNGNDARIRMPPTLKLNGITASPSAASPVDADERQSLVQPRGLPLEAFQTQSTVAGWPGLSASPANEAAKQPSADSSHFNLAARQPDQSQDSGASSEQASGSNRQTAACANPFFDNIRQNRELQHGITEKIPMDLPSMSEAQLREIPPFLQKLVHMQPADRALALAQAFFDIEKAEQNRLIATMQQHSAESDCDPRAKDFASAQAAAMQRPASTTLGVRHLDARSHVFPFSIAAALERGADNRYNNIWTYEHSRVRLCRPQSAHDPGSDYLNGSYVQPPQQLGSQRRYIATQAPLPSTFDAFWTAVWEQNSRVIVMLTREHESGRLQSHPYWLKTEYGEFIRLTKLEEVVLDQAGHKMRPDECEGALGSGTDAGGPLFPTMSQPQQSAEGKREPTTVRRTFLLKNLAEPHAEPRRVVQLQYIAWPDYHIPETPESLLDLMDMAASAQSAADKEVRNAVSRGRTGAAGPMVVHCSAGVGRTGAYIVIDATLDVLRRVRRRQKLVALGSSDASVEPPTWENDLVGTNAAAAAAETPEVDMAPASSPPLGDRFPRTPRRSLKRELSPTGMDIDMGSTHGAGGSARDLSSPPPMLRSRSSESGSGIDGGSNLSSSLGSTGSCSQRDAGAPAAPSGFSNPFSSPTFKFNAAAVAKLRNGEAGASAGAGGVVSPRQEVHSPTRGGALQLPAHLAPDAWRQASSSPFSEVSTPSFHGGGSARSSFSSAAGVHSRLSSANGLSPSAGAPAEASRSIEEALLSAMNPFELALSPGGARDDEGAEMATAVGDASTSTVTGSNEPTPFDVASSQASGFGWGQRGGESMSASDSAGSGSFDVLTGTPSTSASMASVKDGEQMLVAKDHASLSNARAGAADALYLAGQDLVRTIVETVREQRMSLIQTGRQYVFVYSAVLAGVLRDLEREGVR